MVIIVDIHNFAMRPKGDFSTLNVSISLKHKPTHVNRYHIIRRTQNVTLLFSNKLP